MIYKAQDMNKLACSKLPYEQEKEKVMAQIYDAASRGEFVTEIFKSEFTDYRLIIAWLTNLGYKCTYYSNYDFNRIYVNWEK